MNKISFGSLALATILGISLTGAPVVVPHAETYLACETAEWTTIDEKNAYIGDLLAKQSNAYLRDDTETAETIEEALSELNVRKLTSEEIITFNNQLSSVAPLSDDYDGYFTKTDTYTYHQYIVDVGMYSAEFTIIAPISEESNLVKKGQIDKNPINYIQAGANILTILGKEFLGSKFLALEILFTGMDILTGLFEDITPVTIVEDIETSYEWLIAETVCFLSWPRASGAFDIQCISNYVSFDIEAKTYNLEIVDGHTVTKIHPSVLHGEYKSPMYCSTKEYFDFRKTGIKNFSYQEMLHSVDITDEIGKTVHSVKLLNPNTPTAIH